MPQSPTLRQGGFNVPVTNMAVAYAQKPSQGAGWSRAMAPTVGVDSDRGTYKVVNKGDWFRDEMQERADGTEAHEAGYAMSDATYTLRYFSLKHLVSDRKKKNKPAIWADDNAAKYLQQKALIKADRLAVTNLLTAGVGWATELVGAGSAVDGTSVIGWNSGSSTPRANLMSEIDAIQMRIGIAPNRFGMSPDVLTVLRRHPDFTAAVVGGGTSATPGVVSVANIEDILGLPRGAIYIMGTVYNSAAKGQTAVMSYTCAETAWLGYVTPTPSIEEPTACYTFAHNEIDGLGDDGAVAIYTYRDENKRSDAYEADLYQDVRLVAADCGSLFTSVLSA